MAVKEKYATFFLAGIYFGIPAVAVQEVLEYLNVIRVPLAPATLPGIINLRGRIIPVLDLRERLLLAPREARSLADTRMAVVRTDEGLFTLLIDRVEEILDVDSDSFEPPAETLKPGVRAVTSHICKLKTQLLLILDLSKLCQFPEQVAAGEPSPQVAGSKVHEFA
jgi:purine-binding chemotaxis protein CheW